MTTHWKQITQLFTKALKIDKAGRQAWLEQACGEDEVLLDEIQSLLRAYTAPGFPGQTLDELRSLAFSQLEENRMKGKQIGRFQLQELIGAGGMGVVWRARDTRLERDVAIKFPPPAWSFNDHAKQRFLHEARAAASLDHRNVCTIFEADEIADGTLYLAMAYYKGETLRDRLGKGPLPVDEALNITLQTARGLAAAHEHGLIHRDIKPANLMITPRGTVKILDFGIAKAMGVTLNSPDEDVHKTENNVLTKPGQRPGTEAYMAPEQAAGSDIDGRADLWALGVVLYEMLTGERPSKDPEAPSAKRTEVPKEIDDLVMWLLKPNPDDRPGEAGDVIRLLEEQISPVTGATVGTPTTWKGRRSGMNRVVGGLVLLLLLAGIGWYLYQQENPVPALPADDVYTLAVLPFTNMGGDPDDEYFSDGMTEDLLTYLSQNTDFRVISRSSVMRYRNADRNLQEIGEELGASHIVEGSVRRSDDGVRITAQLIDAQTDQHLWAESYDQELEDVFAIQTDISRSIAETLEGRLLAAGEMMEPDMVSPQAHDLYLRGRFLWHRRTEASMLRAAGYFEEAVELAPGYSRALEGLADAYAVLGFYDYLAPDESFPRAREAARRALDLDPNSASAWATLGYVALYHDWDLEQGEDAFRRAIDLSPGYSKARQWYANLLNAAGRFDEAEREMRRAQEMDPLSLIANAALGWVLYYSGQYETAIDQCRLTLDLDPNFELAFLWSGWALEAMGQYDEALDMLEEAVARSGGSGISVASLARLHGLRGEVETAESLLAGLETSGDYVPSFEISKAYMGLGRHGRAAAWLERALEERSHSLVFLRVDPQINAHLDDPEIAALTDRIWLEAGVNVRE